MPIRNADTVRVENLREVQRELRKLQDRELQRELRKANKAAAEVVEHRAEDLAPVKSGALRASIASQGQAREAIVKAGSASRVPYAGPIHFGWPARGIRPQPFIFAAMRQKRDEVIDRYERLLDDLVREVNRRVS